MSYQIYRKHILFIFFSFHLSLTICAQQLIEEVKPSGNIFDLTFQKYKFENGLTVILHQDTTVSNVYVELLYKVGSNNEQTGKTGLAHFFEHLMFTGTKHLSKDALWNLYPKTPLTFMNAQTTNEYTVYENEIPANYLETALWLESERMQFTPEYMNQKNFTIQKNIVLNELAMKSENNIGGISSNLKDEILYDSIHPMHHPVTGYKEDIEKASLDNVRDFFKQWYIPNNAILTISGNINIEKTLQLLNKYYASIPAKTIPMRQTVVKENNLATSIKRTIKYDMEKPYYVFAYPTVKRLHPDEPALDALSYILNQNDNPQRLKDAYLYGLYDISNWISINHPCNTLNGEFIISLQTGDESPLKKAQSAVENTFESFKKKGFTEENLNEFKFYFKNRIYDRIATISGIATLLSNYEFTSGSPNGLPAEWGKNISLTSDKIMSAFNKYLYKKNNIEIECLPIDKKQIKDREKINYDLFSKQDQDALWNNNKQLADSDEVDYTDYSQIPKADTNYFIPKFKCWKSVMLNGIKVYGTKYNATPLSVLQLNIKAGYAYNPINYAGLSSLYMTTLNELLHSNSIYNSLKQIGARIEYYQTTDNLVILLEFPNEHIKKSIVLLDSILFNLRPLSYGYASIVSYQKDLINQRFKEPYVASEAMLRKVFYSKDNIMNYTGMGSAIVLEKWDGNAFTEAVKKLFTTNIDVLYAGNLPGDSVMQEITQLYKYKTDTSKHIKIAPSLQPASTGILFYDKIGTTQSYINIKLKTITNKSKNKYTVLQMVNFILNERIKNKMREETGLSYYCNASIPDNEYSDLLDIKTQINIEKTDTAIILLINELNNFIQYGISQKELDKTKKAFLASAIELPETLNDKLSQLEKITAVNDWNYDNVKKQQLIEAMNTDVMNEFIKNYLKLNTCQIAVVSDKIKVFNQLQKLGYKVTEYKLDKLF